MAKKTKNSAQEKFDAAREREDEIRRAEDDTTARGDDDLDPVTGDKIVRQSSAHRDRPAGMTVVSTGAGYRRWAKGDVFTGYYVNDFIATKDIEANNTKKGDVIGFNFLNDQTGQMEILGNNYSIKKALSDDKFNPKTNWWIEFIEEIKVKGKPFKQFYIAKQN